MLTVAAAPFRMPNARTTGGGIRSCGWLILKFSNDRSVCAPQYLFAGTWMGPKASDSVRVDCGVDENVSRTTVNPLVGLELLRDMNVPSLHTDTVKIVLWNGAGAVEIMALAFHRELGVLLICRRGAEDVDSIRLFTLGENRKQAVRPSTPPGRSIGWLAPFLTRNSTFAKRERPRPPDVAHRSSLTKEPAE